MVPSRKCRLLAILAVVLPFLTGHDPAHADMFKIDNIEVDEEGLDSVAARAQAVALAEKQGLDQLLRRLTAPADHGRLPPAEELNSAGFVRAMDIAQESLSSTRYVATINIAYQAEGVLGLLRDRAIAHVTEQRPDILALPVKSEQGVLTFSTSGEAWHAIWQRIAASGGMVGWRLPEFSLADTTDIVTSGGGTDRAVFASMAERYGVSEILLAVDQADATSGIRYRLIGVHGLDIDRRGLLTADELVAQTASLKRVLDDATQPTAARWKAGHLVRADKVADLDLTVTIDSFAGWAELSRSLDQLSLIRDFHVSEFARTHANLTLSYVGERSDLDAALRSRGLALVQELGVWRLERIDALSSG